jgi:NAD(P)H-binding
MKESHENALKEMEKFGIRRLITISAFGVGDSNQHLFWPMRMVLNHSNMAFAFEDHNAVEVLVRKIAREPEEKRKMKDGAWELKHTLVRPCMLTDGLATKVKVLGEQGKGAEWLATVSRESVASFVVERCLESGGFLGKNPVIRN